MVEIIKSFLRDTPILLWGSVISAGIFLECISTSNENELSIANYGFNIANLFLYIFAILFLLGPATYLKDYLYYQCDLPPLINLSSLDLSNKKILVFATFVYLVVVDFFFYWWHRASHTFEWLWDLHVIHHSDRNMNATTAIRSHWTVFLFELFLTVLPAMFILGSIDSRIFALAGVAATWNFLIHTNINISFGPFSPLLMGPQAHRIHHSIMPEHRDKNFASLFPIWDIVFGTYYHPRKNERPPTGVTNLHIEKISDLIFYPFLRWADRIRKN